jgi:hypothetical protein
MAKLNHGLNIFYKFLNFICQIYLNFICQIYLNFFFDK